MRTVIDFLIYVDEDEATIQFENGSELEIKKEDFFDWLESEYGLDDFREDEGGYTDDGEGSYSKFLDLNEYGVINYYGKINYVQNYIDTLPDLELIAELEIFFYEINRVKNRLDEKKIINSTTCDSVNIHLDKAIEILKSLKQIELLKVKNQK